MFQNLNVSKGLIDLSLYEGVFRKIIKNMLIVEIKWSVVVKWARLGDKGMYKYLIAGITLWKTFL